MAVRRRTCPVLSCTPPVGRALFLFSGYGFTRSDPNTGPTGPGQGELMKKSNRLDSQLRGPKSNSVSSDRTQTPYDPEEVKGRFRKGIPPQWFGILLRTESHEKASS